MFNGDEQAAIERVAGILAGNWSETAAVQLEAAMIDFENTHKGAGGPSRDMWLASLVALGETCLMIAKRERTKFK